MGRLPGWRTLNQGSCLILKLLGQKGQSIISTVTVLSGLEIGFGFFQSSKDLIPFAFPIFPQEQGLLDGLLSAG
jgi:hypothetical protein